MCQDEERQRQDTLLAGHEDVEILTLCLRLIYTSVFHSTYVGDSFGRTCLKFDGQPEDVRISEDEKRTYFHVFSYFSPQDSEVFRPVAVNVCMQGSLASWSGGGGTKR